MITNPWINRIAALVMLVCIYYAGYAGGRDQATLTYQQQAACNLNLKP
jgi:TctA family transporter